MHRQFELNIQEKETKDVSYEETKRIDDCVIIVQKSTSAAEPTVMWVFFPTNILLIIISILLINVNLVGRQFCQ